MYTLKLIESIVSLTWLVLALVVSIFTFGRLAGLLVAASAFCAGAACAFTGMPVKAARPMIAAITNTSGSAVPALLGRPVLTLSGLTKELVALPFI